MADEREFKIRHTTEGAEKAKADIDKMAEAEAHYKDEVAKLNGMLQGGESGEAIVKQTRAMDQAKTGVDKLSGATDELHIKKENLVNVLNRVHPALGGIADSFANAAELAGELGSKSLTLTSIMGGARAAALKYKDALLLLGAGGAAIGAVMLLIKSWQDLIKAEKEAIKYAEDFQRKQSDIAGETEDVRQKIGRALIRKDPTISDEEITKRVAEYRRLAKYDIDEGRALGVAIGEQPPPSEQELERLKQFTGGFNRTIQEARRQAMQVRKPRGVTEVFSAGGGRDRELRAFVEERAPQGVDADAVLQALYAEVGHRMGISARPPGENETTQLAQNILAELNLTKEAIDRQQDGIGLTPQTATDLREAASSLKEAAEAQREQSRQAQQIAEEQREQNRQAQQITEEQREQARLSRQAAEELHGATERMRSQTDRAARRLSSNYQTARMVSFRAGEG